MKLIVSFALALAFASVAAGQMVNEGTATADSTHQVADRPSSYFGPFRINGQKPAGFEGFDFFVLSYKENTDAEKDFRNALLPDKDGNVAVRGETVTAKGTPLTFETVQLVEAGTLKLFYRGHVIYKTVRSQPIKLTFTTVEVKSIKYAFSGEYLAEPVEEEGGHTELSGVLSKFKDGKLVGEAKVGFRRMSYQELTSEEPSEPN